jgi:hypothetical protein
MVKFADAVENVQSAADLAREERKARQARRRRFGKPVDRDLKIFKMVMIQHLRHDEVARVFGLHRTRIVQIVKRLCLELANAPPDDPEIKDHLARQRLEQNLQKMRLEFVLEETAKALRQEPRHLEIKRVGGRNRDGKEEQWEEVTTRQQPVNVQLLKTFLRTSEALRSLREELAVEAPQKKLTDTELFEAINAIFENWLGRMQFEADQPSRAFYQLVSNFRLQMYSWVLSRKEGKSRAEAWPSAGVLGDCELREAVQAGLLNEAERGGLSAHNAHISEAEIHTCGDDHEAEAAGASEDGRMVCGESATEGIAN